MARGLTTQMTEIQAQKERMAIKMKEARETMRKKKEEREMQKELNV